MTTNDEPTPTPGTPEQSTGNRLTQWLRSVWGRRRLAVISGAVVAAGVVIAVTVLTIRPDGYDNTPEGAAQRFVDVMSDRESTYQDLYANACERERREHAGPDRPLQYPGIIHFVIDEVTQISDTKAVATTHLKEAPENSIEILLVKEDGVWRDCGDA